MEQKIMKATEGVRYITTMIKAIALAKEMGLTHTVITNGLNHNLVNGKPYWFTQNVVDRVNMALGRISGQLRRTHITLDETTPSQMKAVCKFIPAPYLIETLMGKSRRWHQNRISTPVCRFKQEEIDIINSNIQMVADKVESIVVELEDIDPLPASPVKGEEKVTEPTGGIPFPPYLGDYDDYNEYSLMWDEWEKKYHPDEATIHRLCDEQMRQRGNTI